MTSTQELPELQEIQLELSQEAQQQEPLLLSTHKSDNLQESYDKLRKEKYRQYYLNKKLKKEKKKMELENPELISEPVISEKKKKSNFTTEEEELLNEIALLQEPLELAEKTKQTHMVAYKMLIKCVSCNREALMHLLLNEPDLTIQMIDSSKKLDGLSDYSNQSKNKILQGIRPLFDLFKVEYTEENLKKYRNKMEQYNFNYLTSCIQKKILPTYDEYLFRMLEFYSDRSLEYLLINLYREVPIRDDFQLKLVSTKAQTKSKQHNYLLLNKKTCQIILNQYKTAKHYGQKTYDLSPRLKEMFIAYISTIETPDEYVFGNRQLSPVICEINKKLGYDGGISFLRKMAVTDLYKKEGVTHEEKQELAERMTHSVNEALLIYSGKLNNEEDD